MCLSSPARRVGLLADIFFKLASTRSATCAAVGGWTFFSGTAALGEAGGDAVFFGGALAVAFDGTALAGVGLADAGAAPGCVG